MSRLWARLLAVPTYRLITLAMLVILGIAFTTSFQSGSDGAGRLGFPPLFVSALPLVCDVIAGVATAIHGRVRQDKAMRRLASWFVLVPMLLSWGANSIDHAYRAAPAALAWGRWEQAGWFTAVVLAAGICPVAVAALLHLSTRFVEFEQRQSTRRAAVEVKAPKPSPAKPATPRRPKPAADDLAAKRARDAARKADYRARKREQAHGR